MQIYPFFLYWEKFVLKLFKWRRKVYVKITTRFYFSLSFISGLKTSFPVLPISLPLLYVTGLEYKVALNVNLTAVSLVLHAKHIQTFLGGHLRALG